MHRRVSIFTCLLVVIGVTSYQMVVPDALVTSVGKIAIPDAILQKPGKLTDEEFDIMKQHTVRGGYAVGSMF